MGLKVYIAAPWIHATEASVLGSKLEELGYVITRKWWLEDGTKEHNLEFLKKCAEADITGVQFCNVLVLLDYAKSEGKAVEQGVAIDRGKPIVAVRGDNDSNNIFHKMRNYFWVKDVDSAISVLAVIDWLLNKNEKTDEPTTAAS